MKFGKTKFFLVLAVVICGVSFTLKGEDVKKREYDTKLSKKFMQKWGMKPIKVRQQYRKNNISGEFPINRTVERCAQRFYQVLDYLPEKLILSSKLKYVTFLKHLKFNGKYVAGLAYDDTIFLKVNFSNKTVFHEFFHIFDPHRHNKQWNKFNGEDFVYTGSKFYEIDHPRDEKKRMRKKLRKRKIVKGFVSEYAMSFEWEDRAETFAYMMVEGKKFLKRTKSPIIKAKMEYIMNLFIERDLLDKEFWEKHFDSKFKLKNRHYTTKNQE